MESRPNFLIVDDNVRVAASLRRALAPHGPSQIARTVAEALALAAAPSPWAGLLVDVALPDGTGLDLLTTLRARGVTAPAVIVASHLEPALVNRVLALDAMLLARPFVHADLRPFLARVLALARCADNRVARVIQDLSVRHQLTPREVELVLLAVAHGDRDTFARDKGVSPGTGKSQVNALLAKLGAPSLADVANRVLRNALGLARQAQ